MARKILKYKLTPQGTIPLEIEDGGYYCDGDWKYGMSVDGLTEVPEGMTELTEAELETHIKSLNLKGTIEYDLDDEEKEDVVDDFLISKGKKTEPRRIKDDRKEKEVKEKVKGVKAKIK